MAEIIIRGDSAELAEIARLLRVMERPAPSQDEEYRAAVVERDTLRQKLAEAEGIIQRDRDQLILIHGTLTDGLKPSGYTEPQVLAEQAVARLQGMRERLEGIEQKLEARRAEAEQAAALEAEVERLTEERDMAAGLASTRAERIAEVEQERDTAQGERDNITNKVVGLLARYARQQRAINAASRIFDAFWLAVERGGLTVVRDAVEAWQADDLDKVESIDFRDPVYDAEE